MTEQPVLKHWVVNATWERYTTRPAGVSTGQVPTFLIDPAIQGALSHHDARKVARDILTSGNPIDGAPTFHITVVPVFVEVDA
jgi:hypothetical protein